ncbi:hypothetical protein AOQ72_06630 [Bradyrhizobium yuanmingense]|uniref:Uncharacterized protein n=1 Tax=Bradyrhizobium yuanmingense TaxID=108015 RepID=A0A0R3D341_9BRAD|nr:hypothetical protein AOQ72_06630 [Bradyrhizobium yuanmingense]
MRECQETTYFSGKLHTFTARLIEVIDHVLQNESSLGPDIVRTFASHALSANRYLAGSTTKESPYEVEYCLQAVIPKWSKRDCLITTALTDERDFHFRPTDPWAFVKAALPKYDTAGFDPLLVQLGVPRVYSHKPLYCVPLYHELGHFVDVSNGVTNLSSLIQRPNSAWELQHRLEHFADLFAAAYIGRCSIRALEIIAPNNATSATHPSTADRVALVEDFLAGRSNGLIPLFQTCLQHLGLPPLQIEHSAPVLRPAFDDIRTHAIANKSELHGIFNAAWEYLEDALDNRSAPWIAPNSTIAEIERVVNDLTEKSIRNASIRERWDSGATP